MIRKLLLILSVFLLLFLFKHDTAFADACQIQPDTLKEGSISSIAFQNVHIQAKGSFFISFTNDSNCVDTVDGVPNRGCTSNYLSGPDSDANSITFGGEDMLNLPSLPAGTYDLALCDFTGGTCLPLCVTPNFVVNTSSGEPPPTDTGKGIGDNCTLTSDADQQLCLKDGNAQGDCKSGLFCDARLTECSKGTCAKMPAATGGTCYTCPSGSNYYPANPDDKVNPPHSSSYCVDYVTNAESSPILTTCTTEKPICSHSQGCLSLTDAGFKESDPPPARCADGQYTKDSKGDVTGCSAIDSGLGILLPTNVGGLINTLFGIFLSLAGGIATLLIIISGYRIMASSGNPERMQPAREQLTAAVVGLLFIIFSIVILQTLGYDILHLPGFNP